MSTTHSVLVKALKDAVQLIEHLGGNAKMQRDAIAQAEAAQPVAVGEVRRAHYGGRSRSIGFDVAELYTGAKVSPGDKLYAAPRPAEAAPTGPLDDFGRPIVYDTEAVDSVTHALTGDEGEDDSVTVLQGFARYVEHVWPGKTAQQVLIEYEEKLMAEAAPKQGAPELAEALAAAQQSYADPGEPEFAWCMLERRHVEVLCAAAALAAQPQQPAPEPVARVPLTENQMLDCVRSVGTPAPMGLARNRGPYEVTEPTWFLIQLVRSVERAHGIAAAPQPPNP